MNRLPAVVALLLSMPLAMIARVEWHAPAVVLAPTVEILDEVPCASPMAIAQVRLAPSDRDACQWSMAWNVIDSANYCVARVHVPAQHSHDVIYAQMPVIEAYSVANGIATEIWRAEMKKEGEFLSLKLVYDGVSARLYGGDSDAQLLGEVPYDAQRGGVTAIATSKPMRCMQLLGQHADAHPLQYGSIGSIDELDRMLADSNDPIEGIWQYLDRDVKRDKASLGGKYRLAIVRVGDGYEIIYLDGADIDQSLWQPLMLKGRLKNTQFQNHYDLQWIDATGVVIDDDNHAQLSDDILTLNFPVYSSSIRLKRSH